MLAKVELLVLLLDSAEKKVAAYFINREHKIVLLHTYLAWNTELAEIKRVKQVLYTLGLTFLLVQLENNMAIGKVVCKDQNNRVTSKTVAASVAIILAQYYSLPIFISYDYLICNGLKVTKTLIEGIAQH